MRFKKAIKIPVHIYTEEELERQKLGLENKDDGFDETEERLYWSIDSAHPEKDHPGNTVFYSSGECYVAPVDLSIFEELINEHIKNNT